MAKKIWIASSASSWGTAGNWSPSGVPTTGDSVYFDGSGQGSVTSGLDQSAVTGIVAIYIDQAYTGEIGTVSGATATYLQHTAANVVIGLNSAQGSPTGSPLLLLNSNGNSCTVSVKDSSSTTDGACPNLPPIQLIGSSLTVDVDGGNVAVAPRAGETATITYTVSQGNGQTVSAPSIYIGDGVTVTSGSVNAGSALNRSSSATTACTVSGGSLDYQGSGGFTTLTINNGGSVFYSGTGTIATLNVAGIFDRTRDGRALTITNTTLYKGAQLLTNNGAPGSTTFTNKPSCSGCGMQDVTFSTPPGNMI